jgi:hypothetical protein
MRFCLAAGLVALFVLAACPKEEPMMMMTPPDMTFLRIFDPCVPNPQPGYDPSSKGHAECCQGMAPAHCVPKEQVLPLLANELDKCDDATVCLPDQIIQAGGQYKPKTCMSSVTTSAGTCLSKCISQVANNPFAAILAQDGCGMGELCVPCINPLDSKPTGACELLMLLCNPPDMSAAADMTMPPADLASED